MVLIAMGHDNLCLKKFIVIWIQAKELSKFQQSSSSPSLHFSSENVCFALQYST